ncbi:MAG: tRNA (adenosine(37)-N6)-threonylcarbamoyltransferase complex transferase subunit TsaD [Patescibacteria group bacterium]
MKILGIETSCDETAVCIIEADGRLDAPQFTIKGDALFSQAKMHAEFGGVYPTLAKREHAKNLVPLLKKALEDAKLALPAPILLDPEFETKLQTMLERETGLYDAVKELITTYQKPPIDLIAVTTGPGLEPALWVGIAFAKALSLAWNIPLRATNHMEGHIVSPLLEPKTKVEFPAVALLISGGHTELVAARGWMDYMILGKTRDDAVGEAFDKTARLLNLPYPGGPEISRLAQEGRLRKIKPQWPLPRPMISTDNLDFSFSGIKTAVLYLTQKLHSMPEYSYSSDLSPEIKMEIALEFENAVTDVLIAKARTVLNTYEVKTLILGGGVVANSFIRESFKNLVKEFPETKLLIPNITHATDNALMIAAAGYLNYLKNGPTTEELKAEGNLSL